MGRRALRHLPLVAVVLLLAVAVVVANTSGPRVGTVPHGTPRPDHHSRHAATRTFSPPPPPSAHPGGSANDWMPPSWLFVVLIAGVVALGYGAIMLYLMLSVKDAVVFRRRRRAVPEEAAEV